MATGPSPVCTGTFSAPRGPARRAATASLSAPITAGDGSMKRQARVFSGTPLRTTSSATMNFLLCPAISSWPMCLLPIASCGAASSRKPPSDQSRTA